MSQCPLVMVEWEDSAQPIPTWTHLANVETGRPVQCVSVGWLIGDDAAVKVLAPNFGGVNDHDNVQVSGVIRIPARCVRKITKIKEPKLTCLGPSSHPARGRKLRAS